MAILLIYRTLVMKTSFCSNLETIYFLLLQPGANKTRAVSQNPNVVSSQQEEDDIAKAIAMSLQETKASPSTKQAAKQNQPQQQQQQQQQALYPTTNSLYGNVENRYAKMPPRHLMAPTDSRNPERPGLCMTLRPLRTMNWLLRPEKLW